jgi:transposase
MELASRLFPAFSLLELKAVELKAMRITPEAVTLVLTPTTAVGVCPACGQSSTRVHSRYHRHLQDVPAHGRVVRLELHLRRFFCDLPGCPQDTFAERMPQIAESHARKTSRLIESLRETAFTAGGEAGSRLAGQLGMPASGDTLLRLLRRAEVPDMANTPKVLGVDDWAIRRGRTYGTILCDLESHRPVDLLPDRSSEALAAWLREHPGAEIISRDRGGDYAKGASAGAPAAIQVADRWHLLHNLTDALQRAVDRQQSLLTEIAREVAAKLAPTPVSTTTSPAGDASPPNQLSREEQAKQNSRARRMARYQQVQELRRQGMGLRKICRTLQMSREAVKRFAGCDQFPERATPSGRDTPLDPYLPFLKERWEQGCDNVGQLWREIKAKGFTRSVYGVRRQIRRWRRACGTVSKNAGTQKSTRSVRIIRPSARRIAWLALGHVSVPTAQDEATLKAICQRWPELQESAELARQFASLLKEHDAGSLEAWIQLTQEPLIFPEVRRFGEVLRQDRAAVVEAIRQPWSQGQVEGQINRLKMIKRQMYGRANFDLLRQRVLHKKAV